MYIKEVVIMAAFNNELFLKLQRENISKRIEQFNNKLYLEFGGKIFDDYHASRVLPGFKIDSKVQMLLGLKEKVEVIIAISASDIQHSKVLRNRYINRRNRLQCHIGNGQVRLTNCRI